MHSTFDYAFEFPRSNLEYDYDAMCVANYLSSLDIAIGRITAIVYNTCNDSWYGTAHSLAHQPRDMEEMHRQRVERGSAVDIYLDRVLRDFRTKTDALLRHLQKKVDVATKLVAETDYTVLSPGVRDICRRMHERGYVTTDSGDGTNFKAGMEGALPFRHVMGIVPDYATDLARFATIMNSQFPGARVEISLSPGEPTIFMLYPDGAGASQGASDGSRTA